MELRGIARPRNLREALGVAFVHRTRTRWRAGQSHLLGLDYPGIAEADGFVVDVAEVADFREILVERGTVRIGAFAEPDSARREPLIGQALGENAFSADVARFRLAALDARLVVAGIGATRTAALADVLGDEATQPLGPSEIPLAIELRPNASPVVFGDRHIRRRDGAATFDLRVYAALALSGNRIVSATIAHSVDGGPPAAMPAVSGTLRGATVGTTTFADAARHAADVFRGDDVRSNTLRRTIIPLVLSALKDTYADARARVS